MTREPQYLVLHDIVGTWRKGSVITAADVAEGDVPRLVRLHAIRPVTAEEIATLPPVDSRDLVSAMHGARPALGDGVGPVTLGNAPVTVTVPLPPAPKDKK